MQEKRVRFSAGYMIPKYSFRLETKPYLFIAESIRNLIESKYANKLKEWELHIIIVFADDRFDPMEKGVVRGPSRNTYDKIMSYGIHLPSSRIISDACPFKKFSLFFFETITDFLCAKFGVSKAEINGIEQQVNACFSPINGKILCDPIY
jgi:hypothetical protein